MSVLIIAEPGCTAQGDQATMLRLLETAAVCGASCWKPQWVSDPVQMCERRQMRDDPAAPANNQKFANASDEFAYYKRAYSWLAWPVEWHGEFRERCDALGLKYAATAFLPQDVATIAPLVDYLKISSFESHDPLMQQAIDALPAKEYHQVLVSDGAGGDPVVVGERLHCVSAYPAPLEAMQLRAMGYMGDNEGATGLSDHSRHLITGAVALAVSHAGLQFIETHYRLDDCDTQNPDYAVAFTPAEFTQYIRNIRDAEVMLGSGEKQIQPCERDMLPYRVTG